MNTQPQVLIFSVYDDNSSQTDNTVNHWNVAAFLNKNNIQHSELKVFNNNKEIHSILISKKYLNLVKDICNKYNIKEYFELDTNRGITLITNNEEKFIGQVIGINKQESLNKNNWIFNIVLNQYYTIKYINSQKNSD